MFHKKRQKFMLSLMLAALSCLSSCTTVNSDYCPVWPTAGSAVAAELEKASCSEFPNTWEWIGRLNKLRQELELCR
nr:MAG TPA: protein of unknown function (DUF4969) [Caudoviricetes sp.]